MSDIGTALNTHLEVPDSRASDLPYKSAFDAEVVKLLYGGNLQITLGAIMVGGILSVVMHNQIEQSYIIGWYSGLIIIYIARHFLLKNRKKYHEKNYKTNLKIFRFLVVLTGLAWGAASIFLFPLDIAYQTFLGITLISICCGSIIAYTIDQASAVLFPTCVVLLSFYNYVTDLAFSTLLILNMLTFLAIVVTGAVGLSAHLRENIMLRVSKKNSNEQLALLSQRQQLHIEHTPLAVIEIDTTLTITFWNAAASKIFGFSEEEAINSNISLILPRSKIEMFITHMEALMGGSPGEHMHSNNLTKNKGIIYCEWFNTVLKDDYGVVTSIAALVQDETAYIKARKEIEWLAYHDALTNLPNSRLLNDRLELAQAKSLRNNHYGCVIYFDIDNFKTINDAYGHAAGDKLLISITSRFRGLLRASDTASRIGGDEFIILLENIEQNEERAMLHCVVVANKIIEMVSKPVTINHSTFQATASIGICLFSNEKIAAEDIIRRADSAMYAAKQAGKNQFQFYDSDIQEKTEYKNKLKNDLQLSVKNQELILHFQPQTDEKGKITGAEVLIRWQHPEHGFISPAEFIPLSEETKQIIPIGNWVFSEACLQLATWQKVDNTKHLNISVNVSAIQFNQSDFVENILAIIESSKCDPKSLTIELTESAVLESFEDIVSKMDKLKEVGISFSLDDFGTGNSSLSVLKNLPLHEVKIDQSFIRTLPDDQESEAIVHTIIAMCRSLSLSVIAEGVETEAQAQFLLESGCSNLQGYLFGKPVEIGVFNQLLDIAQ